MTASWSPEGVRRAGPPTPDVATVQSALLVRAHASFRRASDVLGVNPSVLSRRILALEDSLGVALFQRDASGARPTDAGATFLAHAEQALHLLQRAATEAAAAGRGEVGQLRLGHAFPISSGADRLLCAYRRGAAQVDFHLHDGASAELVTLLLRRDLDVIFIEDSDAPPEAEQLLLATEAWRLATPQDAQSSPGGWPADLPLLALPRDEGRVRRIVLDRGGRAGALSSQTTSYDGLLSLVSAGVGCAVVPESVATRAPPAVRMEPLPMRPAVLRLTATWLPDTANPALRRFLSLMRTHGLRDPDREEPNAARSGIT